MLKYSIVAPGNSVNNRNELSFSIAGMNTRLVVANTSPYRLEEVAQKYDQFATNAQEQVFVIQISVEEGMPFLSIKPGPWEIHTQKIGSIVEFESYMEKGWFDLTALRGELVLRPKGNPENFLRVLYAWRSLENSAILLHASGMIRKEKGYTFFGKSGSGKTTITRNASGAVILSDDLVVLKYEEVNGKNGVRVFGVPFRGSLIEAQRINASAPLCGLYSLVKARDNELRPMSDAEAVTRLAACVPFVMSDPENAKRVLDLCQDINRCVKVSSLHFRPDPEFWSLIDG
jgi:hypothetical protein